MVMMIIRRNRERNGKNTVDERLEFEKLRTDDSAAGRILVVLRCVIIGVETFSLHASKRFFFHFIVVVVAFARHFSTLSTVLNSGGEERRGEERVFN
jgi:hypothetical protein